MLKSRRAGFTLVELLVVIGIIALLISILLPSLNRAREHAQRVNCASQMRQIGQFVAMYAAANRNQVPIGYLSLDTYIPGNSTIWYMSKGGTFQANGPVGLGYLFATGIVKAPQGNSAKVWFCPSMPEQYGLNYRTAGFETWRDLPLGDEDVPSYPFGSNYQKIGYGCRTSFDSTSLGWEQTLRWSVNTSEPNTPKMRAPKYLDGYGGRAAKIRTAKDYNNKAILADLMGDIKIVQGIHKTGVNVLYGNYAVKWVPIEYFKVNLLQQRLVDDTRYVFSNNYYAGDYQALARTWEDFDRH
jgi:prepilin-type N-terminal cleavage/methylation domain-containing protein